MSTAPNRFSLAILMGFIGVLAVGLGLMRNGSWLAGRITLAILPVVLLVGLLGALVRRGEGSWVGFALFGWSYAFLAFAFPQEGEYGRRLNPVAELVTKLVNGLHPGPGHGPAAPALNARFMSMIGSLENLQAVGRGLKMDQRLSLLSTAEVQTFDAYLDQINTYNSSTFLLGERQDNAKVIGHALFALVFALVGSILGRVLERPRRPEPAPTGG